MKTIIAWKGRYALISRYQDYVVACGFDGEEWGQGYYYTHWNENEIKKVECLNRAINHFLSLVDESHISRHRLEELATKFKDGLLECDEDFAREFFEEECELTEKEMEWLGIETGSEEE